jgi:hypothetical protein
MANVVVTCAPQDDDDILLMVPLRLGLDCINACYIESLKVHGMGK